MTPPTYIPRHGTLADRVIEWFRRNPDEELSRADISMKFEVPQSSVQACLQAAVENGELAWEKREGASKVYPLMRVMLASATEPMPEAKRRHQLTRMWAGLAALERAPSPSLDDWRLCSDAVNLMETLVREMGVASDPGGLLDDAVTALAMAGKRHRQGQALRLDAAGIQAVRSILEDYAALLEQIPERVAMDAHRRTERRLREILAGRRRPHDVEIMDL